MYCQLDRSKPCPFPLNPTQTYLGEDENGYYVMDGFFSGIGKMFKRMVKITPKSFSPKNIMKAMTNTAMVAVTGGGYLALPSKIKNTIENAGTYIIPAAAGAAVAATVGPGIMGMLSSKITSAAGLLGKNSSTVGGPLYDVMSKFSPAQQSLLAGKVTAQDIAYAEQHGGQFPPQLMQYVDELGRSNYGYAVNASMNPSQQIDPRQYYANSDLYPGLQQASPEPPYEVPPLPQPAGNWSTGEIFGIVAGAVAVAVLVAKK